MQSDYRGPGIFADYLERDPEEDAYFAVLGRALWLATRFEEGCKDILIDIGLRNQTLVPPPPRFDAPPSAEELSRVRIFSAGDSPTACPDEQHWGMLHMLDSVAQVIEEFSRAEAARPLGAATRSIEVFIPKPEAIKILETARKARNFVAHEAASRFEFITVDDPKKRQTRMSDLRKNVFDLAEGDRLTSLLLSAITGEPYLRGDGYERYVEFIVSWVCDLWPTGGIPN